MGIAEKQTQVRLYDLSRETLTRLTFVVPTSEDPISLDEKGAAGVAGTAQEEARAQ